MALGADRRSVLGMVMREALLVVIACAAAGIPLAYLAGRSMQTMLYGIPPMDAGLEIGRPQTPQVTSARSAARPSPIRGYLSSFRINPTPDQSDENPPETFDRLTKNISPNSTFLSPRTAIVMVLIVSPGLNVNDPVCAM